MFWDPGGQEESNGTPHLALASTWANPQGGELFQYIIRLAVPAPGYPGISRVYMDFPGFPRNIRNFPTFPGISQGFWVTEKRARARKSEVPGPINISASVHFRAFISLLRYPCKSKITLQSKFQPNRTSGYRDTAILCKIWPKFGPGAQTSWSINVKK